MLRVLLVEDHPNTAKLVQHLLERGAEHACDVTVAETLADAVAVAKAATFDVIMLDLGLPDSDGLHTLETMLPAADGVPIICLTANDDDGLALRAVQSGAQDFLAKGRFGAAALRRSVQYAVERRQAIAEMGESGALVEGVLNTARDAIMALRAVRDDDGAASDFRIEMANLACERVLGIPARELVGHSLMKRIPEVRKAGLADRLVGVLETGEAVEMDYPVARDDFERWYHLSAARLRDGLTVTIADISLRKAQEAALESARDEAESAIRARANVLSAISHQVRTPLNSLLGFSEMLNSEVLGPLPNDQYRNYVDDICVAGRQIQGIIDDLLDRKRLEDLQRSERGYRDLIDLAPDLIGVCHDDGEIVLMNQAGSNILGIHPPEALIGRDLREFVHGDFQEVFENGLVALCDQRTRLPVKLVRLDEREVDVEVAAIPYAAEGGAVMLVARDVTERNRATQAIQTREERLRKIMETVVDGIITVDDSGMIETFNPAAERIFGYDASEVIGRSVNMLMPADQAAHHDNYISRYVATGRSTVVGVGREVEGRRKDGTTFPMELALSALQLGERRYFIGVVRDITERKLNEERLRFLASRDPLTGLPNRALFRDRLEQAVTRAEREGHLVGVLFIDLDHFKKINDALGHLMGDRVLQAVGERLVDCVEDHDTVARLSGDEFTVVLDQVTEPEDVTRTAARLLEQLSRPFVIEGKEIYTSGSIGVIVYPGTADTIADLMKNVDTAVHHAKEVGRNNYQFYSAQLSASALRRLKIENALRRAMENRELSLAFQSKVSLTTREVIGAEVLLRWTSPELGVVSPMEFIPVAEETGMIVPIGEWVLRQAVQQLAEWIGQGLPPVSLAVNLSARQFRQRDLAARIAAILKESNLSPELLELELTESMLVDDAETAIKALWTLKGIGVSLAIDDFGTGYSSLNYLKRFPIDCLKIDRAFVKDIPDSQDDMAITKAIVSMAKSLDLKIVAEGIEGEPQAEYLKGIHCDIGQGFWFSKPIPAGDFAKLLVREEIGADNGDAGDAYSDLAAIWTPQ